MLADMRQKFKRQLLRFAKADSGVAAIEFAIVAIPFFAIMSVILETGIMLFVEYTLQASVQEAARLVRTGQAQNGEFTPADFKAKICKTAGILFNCLGGVTVYVSSSNSFATLKASLPSFLDVGPMVNGTPNAATTSYACGGPSQTTAVVATYDWKLMMMGMTFMGNFNNNTVRRLVGFSMFQNEPFPSGKACKAS
jgi:Flp pilus assembly protein TadG